ncbi:MAG: sigma-70 family RNA polymerase sigma factor [Elusimicrobia bacterium]|nr:sigma-70 family RNA polymerase sigma factor [Elusimicrobiota bacterium]
MKPKPLERAARPDRHATPSMPGGLPGMSEQEDCRLIRETLDGRPDAFRRLIEKHQDVVFDLCLRMLGSMQDAEDAAQETFLTVYRHLPEYRPQHKLSNWLYTIALNRCRRVLRRRKILRFLSLEFFTSPSEDSDSAPRELAATDALPDAALEQEHAEELAQKLLAALPATLREAFILRHMKHLSYQQIAQALHLPLSNVKVRIHRAKLFLWKHFGRRLENL